MANSLTTTPTSNLVTSTASSQLTTFTFRLPISGSISGDFPANVLSGSSSLFSGSVAATLSGYNSSLVTATSVVLTLSGKDGLNTYNGYAAGGTYYPSNSSITASLQIYGGSFLNTIISVSANPVATVLNGSATSVIDVPTGYTPGASPDAGTNNYIRTVSNFLRLWNLNG
ncbi:MAG: hypothetical protein EBU90_29455 [Proteobacteria bacterium]|nr:hypothetical protein [Pseudomonadota bacterium]